MRPPRHLRERNRLRLRERPEVSVPRLGRPAPQAQGVGAEEERLGGGGPVPDPAGERERLLQRGKRVGGAPHLDQRDAKVPPCIRHAPPGACARIGRVRLLEAGQGLGVPPQGPQRDGPVVQAAGQLAVVAELAGQRGRPLELGQSPIRLPDRPAQQPPDVVQRHLQAPVPEFLGQGQRLALQPEAPEVVRLQPGQVGEVPQGLRLERMHAPGPRKVQRLRRLPPRFRVEPAPLQHPPEVQVHADVHLVEALRLRHGAHAEVQDLLREVPQDGLRRGVVVPPDRVDTGHAHHVAHGVGLRPASAGELRRAREARDRFRMGAAVLLHDRELQDGILEPRPPPVPLRQRHRLRERTGRLVPLPGVRRVRAQVS